MRIPVFALFAAAALSAALALANGPSQAQPPAGGPGGPGGPPPQGGPRGGMGMMGAPVDSFAAERDSLMKVVLERIAGRENAPAESVFKNIKVMKGRTAAQVVRSMNSFGRSLGVSCKHCHVPNHWADEDKKAKQITRDMMAMTVNINDSLLAKIDFGRAEKAHLGCFTCHRGQPRPGDG
ncbi:MAG: c-type cytochrome, partial [Candidatus Eisenbacteria bacterium]|nr:c-type cytochrome [Candidatus Eisenbacteria bacterium]